MAHTAGLSNSALSHPVHPVRVATEEAALSATGPQCVPVAPLMKQGMSATDPTLQPVPPDGHTAGALTDAHTPLYVLKGPIQRL